MESLIGALGAHPAPQPAAEERVLLDTFDGRLHRRGLTLWKVVSNGRDPARLLLEGSVPRTLTGTLTGTPTARLIGTSTGTSTGTSSGTSTGGVVPSRPGRILIGDLPSGALRDALTGPVAERALLERARLRLRSRIYEVRNGAGKTVVRLAAEDLEVLGGSAAYLPLGPRLRVRPVLGYDRDLSRVMAKLDKVGARPEKMPVVDEALGVLGVAPGGVSSDVDVAIDRAMTAARATGAICRRLAEIVEANLPGTVDDVDPEFLHDLRVAIRRSRSVLREMRGVLPPEETERSRKDLGWIQEVTGPTRDLDVMLLDWPSMETQVPEAMRPDLEPLRRLLQAERDRHFRAMRRHLRSRRFVEAWDAWRHTLAGGVEGAAAGPDSEKPIGALAGGRIVAVYRHMVRMGSAIDDSSPAGDLHELRKRGKELRYLLELFGPMWPSETVKPLITSLKGLQDTLGHFQDDEIQIKELRSLGPTLAPLPGGTDSLIALGFVIEDLAVSQARGRSDFSRRFSQFANRSNRELVATTFGHGKAGAKAAEPARPPRAGKKARR